MLRVLRRPRIVENSTVSPSRLAHTTLDCGEPSGLSVHSTRKALRSSRSRANSVSIVHLEVEVPGREHGQVGQLGRADRGAAQAGQAGEPGQVVAAQVGAAQVAV